MGLFLVEPKQLDANIAKTEARAAKKAEAGKKRKLLSDAAEQPATKRAAVEEEGFTLCIVRGGDESRKEIIGR
jgi:hypothetical protein